jgi:hypothetical protein
MMKNSKKRTQKIKILPSVGSPDARVSLGVVLPIIVGEIDLRNEHQPDHNGGLGHSDLKHGTK